MWQLLFLTSLGTVPADSPTAKQVEASSGEKPDIDDEKKYKSSAEEYINRRVAKLNFRKIRVDNKKIFAPLNIEWPYTLVKLSHNGVESQIGTCVAVSQIEADGKYGLPIMFRIEFSGQSVARIKRVPLYVSYPELAGGPVFKKDICNDLVTRFGMALLPKPTENVQKRMSLADDNSPLTDRQTSSDSSGFHEGQQASAPRLGSASWHVSNPNALEVDLADAPAVILEKSAAADTIVPNVFASGEAAGGLATTFSQLPVVATKPEPKHPEAPRVATRKATAAPKVANLLKGREALGLFRLMSASEIMALDPCSVGRAILERYIASKKRNHK